MDQVAGQGIVDLWDRTGGKRASRAGFPLILRAFCCFWNRVSPHNRLQTVFCYPVARAERRRWLFQINAQAGQWIRTTERHAN